jgi:hypothetical protein
MIWSKSGILKPEKKISHQILVVALLIEQLMAVFALSWIVKMVV